MFTATIWGYFNNTAPFAVLSDFETFTVCVCALVINSCKIIPEHKQCKWRKRFGMVMYARNFRT